VYSSPSIHQIISYLHAAAGYPVEDTWTNAIAVGFFYLARTHGSNGQQETLPKSDKTVKGHMKKQHQGVRSTNIKEEELAEETIPELGTHQNVSTNPPNAQTNQSTLIRKHPPKSKKINDVYKIHNVS
jgi:hypothetical protein